MQDHPGRPAVTALRVWNGPFWPVLGQNKPESIVGWPQAAIKIAAVETGPLGLVRSARRCAPLTVRDLGGQEPAGRRWCAPPAAWCGPRSDRAQRAAAVLRNAGAPVPGGGGFLQRPQALVGLALARQRVLAGAGTAGARRWFASGAFQQVVGASAGTSTCRSMRSSSGPTADLSSAPPGQACSAGPAVSPGNRRAGSWPDQLKRAGNSARRAARDGDRAVFSGSRSFQRGAGNRQLVEEQHAVVRQRNLARPRRRATHQRHRAGD